ncbi:MAG: FAD:protein FMN transferase [Betaproteobacteria bacterium]|nr:MAG: FAD:protein FMN transferase [Betaproteobacteria bacterium]
MSCDRVRRARPLLGTLVEITLAGQAESKLHEAADAAFAEIARIHELMSVHSKESDLYRVNNAAVGSAVPVDTRTWQVLNLAAEISGESNGVFDVTVGAAMMARGALPRMVNGLPDRQATYRDIELLPGDCVRLQRELAIDLGGIAKGYAVDRAVCILRKHGVPAGCVNAGGDLRAFGDEVQTVHVRDPLEPAIARAEVKLRNRALATSANYAGSRGFDSSGVVLDPRDKRGVVAGRSASVRAEDCAVADALAKCVLLTGTTSALLLRRFGAQGFLIEEGLPSIIGAEEDGGVLSARALETVAGRFDGAYTNRQSGAMIGNRPGACS